MDKTKKNELKVIKNQNFKMKEIHFSPDSEFGAKLFKQIKSVDDGTKFLAADEFLKKYKYLEKG